MGIFASPNSEDALRLFLILNNVVGLSLSFINPRAAYIVLGTILGVSLVFNLVSMLAQSKETRNKLKNNDPVRPSLVALGIEVFGTIFFLVMYVITLVDTLSWDGGWWDGSSLLVHAYSGMTGIIAFIMHAFLALRKTAQYIRYRQSLSTYCPHCKRDNSTGPELRATEPSPLALTACEDHSPRVSFAANSVGEGENDNLIMKE